MPLSSLASLSAALAQPDDVTLRASLVDVWRQTRSPEIANAVQRLAEVAPLDAVGARIARATNTKATDEALPFVVEVCESADDPRMTVAFVRWMNVALWPGSGGLPQWTAIVVKLIALEDARAIAPLRSAAGSLPPFLGIAHGKKMTALFAEAADAIERAVASRVAAAHDGIPGGELDPSTRDTLAARLAAYPARDWFARPKKRGASADVLSIVAPVWENVDDDALRLVVADRLLEAGEAWGELINVQFALARGGTPDIGKEARVQTLLQKLAPTVIGPIAKIAHETKVERGFLHHVATRHQLNRRAWEEAASAPHWATVRSLIAHDDAPKWWITALLKNPSTRNLLVYEFKAESVSLLKIERASVTEPWKITFTHPAWSWQPGLKAFLEGLPDDTREAFATANPEHAPKSKAKSKKKPSAADAS